MKRTIVMNNIWMLTAAAVAVGIYLALCWKDIALDQRLAGLFIIAITLHEWEESRFPGGFIELMAGKFGFDTGDAYTMQKSRIPVLIAILFFSFVPFFLWQCTWLLAVPAFLGIFEAFIHLVGIKLHHMPHPYTPGLATALVLMLPISIGLLWVASPHIVWWGWVCAAAYYLACFLFMEIGTLRTFGLYPKDMPTIARNALRASKKK